MTGCWWDLAQNSSNRGSKKGSKMTHLDPSRTPSDPRSSNWMRTFVHFFSHFGGSGALGGVQKGVILGYPFLTLFGGPGQKQGISGNDLGGIWQVGSEGGPKRGQKQVQNHPKTAVFGLFLTPFWTPF